MKNFYSCLLVLFTFFLTFCNTYGQNSISINNYKQPNTTEFCGTDFFHNKKMESDVQYRARHLKTMESMSKVSSQKGIQANGIYQIPVVVHVMHKGEVVGSKTNISDDDVKRGIEYLNNYWRKVSGSHGDGLGVDMKIEFALAVQDENGDCTNGIDRVDMSSVPAYVNNGVNRNNSDGIPDYDPTGGINSLKEYSIWDPTKYYNVWIVDEIDNANCNSGGSYTAGYAFYAAAHGQPYDGSVVLICSYLNDSSTVWAHEMGHALNLPHTFDGDDFDNDVCGDDGIFDTPSHIRTLAYGSSVYFNCTYNDENTCDPSFDEEINPDSGFRRDTGTFQDHMHNYMDYTGCDTEFTGGQRAVVTDALTVTRASYLSSPGLTPPATASVYFTATKETVCTGGTVTFYDKSSCTPNTFTNNGYDNVSFLWTIDNGVDTPYTSTDQNATITFSNSGTYDVTLAVTNPAGTTSLLKAGHISVDSGVVAGCSVTTNSDNANKNFNTGVTSVSFNSLYNVTGTAIPANPVVQDFTCSNNTTINLGASYTLEVLYKSRASGSQFLEVWIDWDNSGTFETSNANGDNERVLSDDVAGSNGRTFSASENITAPNNATLDKLLRMRVISNFKDVPNVCGEALAQRADDYGVYIKSACASFPTAVITNNSAVTVLTCALPEISLTASGGVSYLWNNNQGIDPSATVSEPGTYEVTVTDVNGCTDTETIVITEDKPLPLAGITNNTGVTALTCDLTTINVTASGGVSYSWDNGLGNTPEVNITAAGTYTVTVTSANSCTDTASIVITGEQAKTMCSISSLNDDANFGIGVTNVTLNTINKTTSTNIPAGAMQNFICSDNTTIDTATSYDLNVTYSSIDGFEQYLEVWIDWDNSGTLDESNLNGDNELVLTDNVGDANPGSHDASGSLTPPENSVVNTLIRMRVISEASGEPLRCGGGFAARADDYGIIVTNTLSVNDFENVNFKIYPNPVKDYFTVSLENNGVIKGYEIYDIAGKIVMYNSKTVDNNINTSGLPSGFYFLKVKTSTASLISKFIKK